MKISAPDSTQAVRSDFFELPLSPALA